MDLQAYNSVGVISLAAASAHPRLSRQVLEELLDLIQALRRERLFEALVLAAGERSFAAGAEIRELRGLRGQAGYDFAGRGQQVMNEIASFPQPIVAAIRGYCLGGGLDLALACHARVATYDAAFAHPGATLGLLTGWGGTQRLPRLIGGAQAMEMFLTGERLPATQALTLGLVDMLVPDADLVSEAADYAKRRAAILKAA